MERSTSLHHFWLTLGEQSSKETANVLAVAPPLLEAEKSVPVTWVYENENNLIHVPVGESSTKDGDLQPANCKNTQQEGSRFEYPSSVSVQPVDSSENIMQVSGYGLVETALVLQGLANASIEAVGKMNPSPHGSNTPLPQHSSKEQLKKREDPPKTQNGKEEEEDELLFQCSLCPGVFTLKKNLYVHLRKKHQVVPDLGGSNICPLRCGAKFRAQKALRSHLTEMHDQILESESHSFESYAAFAEWKKAYQSATGQCWVRHISAKNLAGGEVKAYHTCRRSGTYTPKKSDCKRQRPATVKMGTTCPSVMEVSTFKDESVDVLLWKTHIGHGKEIPRTSSKSCKRKKKASKISWEVCVVIPAAGTGQRMGGDTPKQFISVHQKPIVCYTVDAFLSLSYVKKVVVVAAPDSLELMLQKLGESCQLQGEKLVVTEGAGTRHESIYAGLKALQTSCEPKPELVIIHDAVRPFITEDCIREVIHAANEYGAAGLTCPLVSTVVSPDATGFLENSLDRNKYVASEMPQAFKFDLIYKVYGMCSPHDMEYGTECLHLMQKYLNINAKLLPGATNLWKVTHPKDIYSAIGIIKENQSACIISRSHWSSLASNLQRIVEKSFKPVQSYVKFREAILTNHPNIVQIGEEEDPYPVLDRLTQLESKHFLQQTTLVHVFVNVFDSSLNLLEFQKHAKYCARRLKEANFLVYFVIYTGATETVEELGELLRSLLFDSNPSISGSMFLY